MVFTPYQSYLFSPAGFFAAGTFVRCPLFLTGLFTLFLSTSRVLIITGTAGKAKKTAWGGPARERRR